MAYKAVNPRVTVFPHVFAVEGNGNILHIKNDDDILLGVLVYFPRDEEESDPMVVLAPRGVDSPIAARCWKVPSFEKHEFNALCHTSIYGEEDEAIGSILFDGYDLIITEFERVWVSDGGEVPGTAPENPS